MVVSRELPVIKRALTLRRLSSSSYSSASSSSSSSSSSERDVGDAAEMKTVVVRGGTIVEVATIEDGEDAGVDAEAELLAAAELMIEEDVEDGKFGRSRGNPPACVFCFSVTSSPSVRAAHTSLQVSTSVSRFEETQLQTLMFSFLKMGSHSVVASPRVTRSPRKEAAPALMVKARI